MTFPWHTRACLLIAHTVMHCPLSPQLLMCQLCGLLLLLVMGEAWMSWWDSCQAAGQTTPLSASFHGQGLFCSQVGGTDCSCCFLWHCDCLLGSVLWHFMQRGTANRNSEKVTEAHKVNDAELFWGKSFFAARQRGQVVQVVNVLCMSFGIPQLKHTSNGKQRLTRKLQGRKLGEGSDPGTALTCNLSDSILYKLQSFSFLRSVFMNTGQRSRCLDLFHSAHHISSIYFSVLFNFH